MDNKSCEACKKLNGFCFLPSKRAEYSTPVPTCKSRVCRCQIMGFYWDEATTVLTDARGPRKLVLTDFVILGFLGSMLPA